MKAVTLSYIPTAYIGEYLIPHAAHITFHFIQHKSIDLFKNLLLKLSVVFNLFQYNRISFCSLINFA